MLCSWRFLYGGLLSWRPLRSFGGISNSPGLNVFSLKCLELQVVQHLTSSGLVSKVALDLETLGHLKRWKGTHRYFQQHKALCLWWGGSLWDFRIPLGICLSIPVGTMVWSWPVDTKRYEEFIYHKRVLARKASLKTINPLTCESDDTSLKRFLHIQYFFFIVQLVWHRQIWFQGL